MTTGALIFAFNNEQTNYLAMAKWNARNIRRHLNIPVAVVTDCQIDNQNGEFDRVIVAQPESGGTRWFEDYEENVTWYNAGRVDAYSLTPWDRTLVLDADYVVASNQLKTLFDSNQNFLAHRWAYDVTGLKTFDDLNHFGQNNMPMSWATVMWFVRSPEAEAVFDIMNMVKQNQQHYWSLYGVSRSTYRNDYALSIALNTVYGYQARHPEIPWRLASLTPEHSVECIKTDCYRVDFVTPSQQRKYIILSGHDFHAMGKKSLEAIVEKDCC